MSTMRGTAVERPRFKSRQGRDQRTLRKNTPIGRLEGLGGHLKREGVVCIRHLTSGVHILPQGWIKSSRMST